ncbi:hypothetical protein MTR67_040620 [Solanum verrucosum]|uniref:Bifunctional inhibitor/plant lipid transfer protein/seed storage helical domain-containing protein n=1 Tax=Solanum verrucosum TaxID=315347 RepID=A0AAF0UK43_SOLVR|nr:hypothetical protein MTR67_040620 [Solanum verrucosum]
MASKRIEIALTLTLVLVFVQWDGVRAQSGCTTALPRCLCSVLNGGGSSFGVSINQTQAVALPSACNVQTPPVSRCNGGANGPAASPADSPPADSSKGSPDIPSGTGSKASGGGTSDGSIVELTVTWIFTVAFTAFASTFF